MRKDSRKVIKAHMVDAINALGGVAHGDDVKTEILKIEGALIEDFGRTPANTKYPEGRWKFVESFTHISRDLKAQGVIFSPARYYVSTSADAVAPVAPKAPKTTKPRKSKKKAQEVETEVKAQEVISEPVSQEVDVAQAEVISEPVVEVAEALTEALPQGSDESISESHTPLMGLDEDEIEDTDRLDPSSPRSLYAYADREKEVRVDVDENGRAWVSELTDEDKTSLGLSESESFGAYADELEVISEPVAEDQELNQQEWAEGQDQDGLTLKEVEPFGAEVKAYVDEEKGYRVGEDSEGLEYTRPIDVVPTKSKVDEYVLSESETQEGEIEAEVAEVISEAQEVVEAEAEAQEVVEEVISEPVVEVAPAQETEMSLDDLFDDEDEGELEEARQLFLKRIEGTDFWGKVEEGRVFLSEHEDGSVTLSFNQDEKPFDFLPQARRNKQQLILDDAKKKGLEGYASKISVVTSKTKERALEGQEGWETHAVDSKLGCFGAEGVDRTNCSQVCALSALCMNAEIIRA